MKSNLLNGINTMIISPRRWGKSSLVEKVLLDINLKDKKTKTVNMDLFSYNSQEAFLEGFTKEVIKASTPKWQEWVKSGKDFFNRIIPKISIGIDPLTDFSISFDWEELKKHSDEILNLPEVIAIEKDFKMIICLDEFQNLAGFSDFENFEKKMRAVWQRQKNVTYCLYGSKRHMMTDIFNSPSKPFYRFGDIMMLPKIETVKWTNFIIESFKSSGKQIDESVAAIIPMLMKNHSWYVQQLSHYTWNLTDIHATISEIEAGFIELIQANSPLYQNEVENLSTTQLNLLKAVAKGEKQFSSVAVMSSFKLGTPRNVSKNKTLLINNDIIQKVDGRFEFLDPAFETWFKKQFFDSPYFPLSDSWDNK
ncbi:MAG: ATP-binding protein [Bacteroidales bacterium]